MKFNIKNHNADSLGNLPLYKNYNNLITRNYHGYKKEYVLIAIQAKLNLTLICINQYQTFFEIPIEELYKSPITEIVNRMSHGKYYA